MPPISFTIEPSETGLLVIDMQNGFASPDGTLGKAGLDISMTRSIVPNIQRLIGAAREAGVHVLWSRQVHYPDDKTRELRRIPGHLARGGGRSMLCARGTWDAEIVDDLKSLIRPEDDVFQKHRASCFYSTNLEAELRIHGIRMLIVTGTTSSFCVDSTIREAYARDFDVIVPSDAISDTEAEATKAVLRSTERFHGYVTTTDDLVAKLEEVAAAHQPVARRVTDDQRGPLHGVRVVEAGQLIAGPFCGHLFADYGAEVIKVEPPGEGDPMRRWGGLYKGVGLYWPLIAREKKSVTLDLRRPEGQELLRELVATADVLVENFKPGTLEKWGLGWDRVREINPRVTMVRVSGYGQTGPYRDKAGFGGIAEAMSGFRHLSGEPGRTPVRVGISIGDALAATHGFIGALLSLYARDRPGGSGRGQAVDVGIYEALWVYMESILPEYAKLGQIRQPTGSYLPGIAPSNVYPTADGQWVVIGANQDNVFKRFATILGHPEWSAEGAPYSTHNGRGERQFELDELVVDWTSRHSSEEILREMDAGGVPAGRIYTAAEIARDPQFAARDMIVELPDPGLDGETVPMQGVVPKMSDTPGRVTRGGPTLGQHNQEVWRSLVGAERLAELEQAGVI